MNVIGINKIRETNDRYLLEGKEQMQSCLATTHFNCLFKTQ